MADLDPTQPFAPTTLVLVRHGESNVTVRRVIGGFRSCDGLSPLGRQQAERLRERLGATGEWRPDVLLSSNFQRAIETAEAISAACGGIEIEVDSGFGEHDPGPDIDGLAFAEYVDRYGSPDWTDSHAEVFPGGETVAQFHLRVGDAVSRAVREHRGKVIVVACHGGVVDAAFRLLLRTAPTGAFELHTLNTSITAFTSTATGRWRLDRYNDIAHLHGLPLETPREG
jgi:probable phosphoglycerate mutase